MHADSLRAGGLGGDTGEVGKSLLAGVLLTRFNDFTGWFYFGFHLKCLSFVDGLSVWLSLCSRRTTDDERRTTNSESRLLCSSIVVRRSSIVPSRDGSQSFVIPLTAALAASILEPATLTHTQTTPFDFAR
jgi:hypothetical protein